MEDSFAVHLVSNVSTDIYPNNKPSQFSTLLADNINLSNGEWEVAVKDIMYPSHVASTTEDDKLYFHKTNRTKFRTLIPHAIDPQSRSVKPWKRNIRLNRTKWQTLKKAVNGNEMVKILNSPIESKTKNIYQFGFDAKKKKLTLSIKVADFIVTLDPLLSMYLGFEASAIYCAGDYWASRPIDDQPNASAPAQTYMQFYDLQYMNRTEYNLQVSVNKSLQSVFSTDIPFDIKDETNPPTFKFVYNPEDANVHLFADKNIVKKPPEGNRPIIFFTFDDAARKLIPSTKPFYGIYLPHIYTYPHYNSQLRSFTAAKVSTATTVKLVQQGIKLTIWSLAAREEILKPDLSTVDVVTLKSKEVADPKDFLPILNEKTSEFGYRFSYNKDEERFAVIAGKSHAIKMSESLASILGFTRTSTQVILNETKTADSFPLLHRAITDIYIYSNIVQEVYLGNVKAPLLLSCPFRRDGNYNNITYIEFMNPTFTDLNRTSLQQIDIDIRDATGKPVPFLFGRTVINLLFRRRQEVL